MSYNFDQQTDRTTEYSAKYYELKEKFGDEDLIPLWIADMDLKVATPITKALEERVKSGIFGYTSRPDFYNEAIVSWLDRRHDWDINKDLLMFSPGVMPSVSMILQNLSAPMDNIIIQQPVYSPFASVVELTGRTLKVNPLIQTEAGDYVMDYDHLESLIDDNTKFMILCNPHNPVGRVWSKEELKKLAEICLKHNVSVISDEIHCDLVFKGKKHVPFASLSKEVSEITITCLAPSKTFNIPGLQASVILHPNKETFNKIDHAFTVLDIKRNNCFSLVATHAGYSEGDKWLDEVMDYIESNAEYVVDFVTTHLPQIKVKKPEGTYLLWLDCKGLGLTDDALKLFMIKEAKLALSSGNDFGAGGSGFQRINIACPREILVKALDQLRCAINKL